MLIRPTPRTLTVLAVACVVGLASTAQAQRGPRGQRHQGPNIDRLIERLELSDEQAERARALAEQKRTTTQPIHEQVRQRREQMRQLWQSDEPDRDSLLALQAEIHALRGQMAVARIDFRLGLHAILTPEQRAKAQQMMDRRGRRGHRGRFGRRGGQRGGQGRGYHRGQGGGEDFQGGPPPMDDFEAEPL